MAKHHRYTTAIRWTGSLGQGTVAYRAYSRNYEVGCTGKEVIKGSSDPSFLGDGSRWNPEEMLVSALSACHQLWYLSLCADNKVVVVGYSDEAEGIMAEEKDGEGQFESVTLRPVVVISPESDCALASRLHDTAHHMCFIARSVNFPVIVVPETKTV